MDNATHHAAGKGIDPLEMGRWTWVRVKGRNNIITRIYSIYRPCKSHGPHTTYTQQVNALNKTQDLRCPQTAMMEDEFCESLDLKNAIFEHHGENGPPTFEAGRDQIDGILASSTIKVRRCGYLPHTISPATTT
mmetsp:Transcript_26479/g.37595  ORF Transcript_26479/g.37595 Transcript_26479/m.37595 type:complete len:134 (-) Transcript_26479:104-505(-)